MIHVFWFLAVTMRKFVTDLRKCAVHVFFKLWTHKFNESFHIYFSASRNLSQLSAKKSGSIEIKEKDCDIRGMAVTNNNTILLADYNNGNIKSVSADGRVLSVLSLPSSPRVITVRDTTTAVATANNNKKIFIINIADYNTLSLISQSQLGYTIMAIVTYKGNLAVTCATEPKTTKLITIYGGVVWSVGRDTLGRNLFDSPYGITTMTTNDTTAVVVVTDARKRTLTMLEAETGIFLRSIDVEGKGPWGIVMDNDNNSYVCYKVPKEICVWSDDFQESKILLSGDKLGDFPRFVVYSAADHSLYVSYHQMSDSRNTVDKFRLI